MPLVIKIIVFFPLNYDKNLEKKFEYSNVITFFHFFDSILYFTEISLLRRDTNPKGREKKNLKNETTKK